MPDQADPITTITEAYNRERYGGLPPDRGTAWKAWRSLRPQLYRAALTRLVEAILPGDRD
jgi:hypothetical protein